jgi:biopolymer transport protein ExbD
MRLDLDENDEDFAINLTPMIDMVFLLLIFFLAATTFAKEEVEMDLRLPQAQSGTEDKGGHLMIVNVFADGRLSVDSREVTLEALRQKLQAAGARSREQAVLIRSDARGQVGTTIQVIDACRIAKITKFNFAAMPENERH